MTKNDKLFTKKEQNSVKSELKSIFLLILAILTLRIFIAELFYVPTGSMRGNILEGDYIFSTKYNYGYSIYSIPLSPNLFTGRIFAKEPQYGDVIIMRPPHQMRDRYVKRLIGMAGDKIEIKDDLIYINELPIKREEAGLFVSEDNIEYLKFKETLPNGVSYFAYKHKILPENLRERLSNFGPIIVEAGKYFFLGDNRDNSNDSRYQLKTVSADNFIAKGRFVIFSTKIHFWDSSFTIWQQMKRFGSWFVSIRLNRIGSNLYSN